MNLSNLLQAIISKLDSIFIPYEKTRPSEVEMFLVNPALKLQNLNPQKIYKTTESIVLQLWIHRKNFDSTFFRGFNSCEDLSF